MDDDSDVLAQIRHRLAEYGESADDFSDDELRAVLRIVLLNLALEFSPEGARTRLSSPTRRRGYSP